MFKLQCERYTFQNIQNTMNFLRWYSVKYIYKYIYIYIYYIIKKNEINVNDFYVEIYCIAVSSGFFFRVVLGGKYFFMDLSRFDHFWNFMGSFEGLKEEWWETDGEI